MGRLVIVLYARNADRKNATKLETQIMTTDRERTETIQCVAIKSTTVICFLPEPFRHADVWMDIEDCILKGEHTIQGFMTNKYRFVTREEAYIIAKEAGQIIKRHDVTETPGTLYSEDLW